MHIYALTHAYLYFAFITRHEGHNPCKVLRTKPATKTETKNPSLLPFLDVFSFLDRALGGFYVLSLMPCCLTPGHLGPSEIHQKSNQMDTQVVGSHNNRRQNH